MGLKLGLSSPSLGPSSKGLATLDHPNSSRPRLWDTAHILFLAHGSFSFLAGRVALLAVLTWLYLCVHMVQRRQGRQALFFIISACHLSKGPKQFVKIVSWLSALSRSHCQDFRHAAYVRLKEHTTGGLELGRTGVVGLRDS